MKKGKWLVFLLVFCLAINLSGSYLADNHYDKAVMTNGGVTLSDQTLPMQKQMAFVSGRLFLPLEEFVRAAGGTASRDEDRVYHISFREFQYTFSEEDSELFVYQLYVDEEDTAYISVYDVGQLFHLAVVFDSGKNMVKLYPRDMPEAPEDMADGRKAAYLRLEDVSAQITAQNRDEYLEKMRVIMDYLYSRGQEYHIAWIPRYVEPEADVSNDLTKNFNFYNAHFLYTLDYAVHHGGHIVLHGYTHQEGDTKSGVGVEFGTDSPYTNAEQKRRMKRAKETARELGYDDSIFEFPHYSSTNEQLRMAEGLFDIIYQQSYYHQGKLGKIDEVNRGGKQVLYVPTPIGYVTGVDELPEVLARIDALPEDQVTSMFIHPYVDFENITCETKNGRRVYQYNEDGVFGQVVKKITEKGMVFSPIQ